MDQPTDNSNDYFRGKYCFTILTHIIVNNRKDMMIILKY